MAILGGRLRRPLVGRSPALLTPRDELPAIAGSASDPAAFGAVQGSLRVERTNRLPHDLRRHAGRGSESWHGRSPALDRLRRSRRRTPRFSPAVQRTLFLILADAKRRPSSDLRVRVYVTNAPAGGLTLLDLATVTGTAGAHHQRLGLGDEFRRKQTCDRPCRVVADARLIADRC